MRLRVLLPLLLAGAVAGHAATRAAERAAIDVAPAGDDVALEPVLAGLDRPVDLVLAPGEPERIYVVEQAGAVRVVERERLLPTPFLDLAAETAADGERGLLSLAFDPAWPAVRRVYAHLTDPAGDTRVLALELAPDGRVARRTVLLAARQPHPNHNGGPLRFGPDGRLYLALGDGGGAWDADQRAQDPRQPYGKLLVLDPRRPGTWRVAARGLRNPWRLAWDDATGQLLIADVGQDRVEEVDVLDAARLRPDEPAANLGWSAYEGRRRLPDRALVEGGPLVWPAWTYAHDAGRCSITGGAVVRGRAAGALAGRYVAADFCTGEVFSLAVRRGALAEPRLEPGRLEQATAFVADGAGRLYAATLLGGLWRFSTPRGDDASSKGALT